MSRSNTPHDPSSGFFQRLRTTLGPKGMPTDDRGRMRMVLDSMILHIHPAKVEVRTLRFTYTWGLGGLSALLIMLLMATGILLEMNYTPSPPQAYLDILNLRANVWFGELIRNIHHWSANLLVVVSILHLLRVFFTGAYRSPRETNWIIGVVMLLLVLGANFTGYLLPWDQLAFWAITVGTSIVEYVPVVGSWLSNLLLGGPEVSATTLLNFYAMHISIIPVSIVMLMSYHFWRVRKDGGLSIPKTTAELAAPEEEAARPERVTTIPHLVRKELIWALTWLAVMLTWGMLISAPLEGIANPDISPNPAKAPWYFMGLQELLLHFHPVIAAVLIPLLALTALALLPFYDITLESVGVYFRSWRGRYLTLIATSLALFITPIWVLVDEYALHWTDWFPTWPTWISNGLLPLSLLLVGFAMLQGVLKIIYKTNLEERVLIGFTYLFTALIVLTIIGIFFRGEGMQLIWPWEINVHAF